MKPVRYVVKSGDSLWSIAAAHYGDPVRWPDLYAYNNRPDIVALTERPIVNPDRMIAGQAIFLPTGHARASQRRAPAGQAANPLRTVGSAGLPPPGGTAAAPGPGRGWGSQAARGGPALIADSLARNAAAETLVNDFAHVFHLDGAEVEVRAPAFSATLSLTGTVSLQRDTQVPLVRYSSRGAETQARTQSAMLLGQLLSTRTTRLGWDARGDRVAYEATLLANAGLRPPTAALGQGVTARGEPVLKATVPVPDVMGRIANHVYLVRGLAVAVALKPGAPAQAAAGRQADDRAAWLWAEAATTSSVLIVGAVLDADAVTSGSGLAEAATTLAGTAAGRRGRIAPQAFAGASPTPVQIGGR